MPWLVYQSKNTLNLLMDLVTDALLTTKHLTLACLAKQMTAGDSMFTIPESRYIE